MVTLNVVRLSEVLEAGLSAEEVLIRTVNRGYDKPRYKYGVILSPRIKFNLVQDLDLLDSQGTWFGVCYGSLSADASLDAGALTQAYIAQGGSSDVTVTHSAGELKKVLTKEKETGKTQILGTVALKPSKQQSGAFELSAFTSFYPGLGRAMFEAIETFARSIGCQTLFASVIVEHQLVPYYEKLGFEVTGTELAKLGASGYIESDGLEEAIRASQDFSLAILQKHLD